MYKYVVDYIPYDESRRPGNTYEKSTLTIHSTANPSATARNERDYLGRRTDWASFHYVVDETELIACIPANEPAYHTSNQEGIYHSISLEICQRWDCIENGILATVQILKEQGLGVDRLRTHQSWTGKYCPSLLLDVGKWDWFKGEVNKKLEEEVKPVEKVKLDKYFVGNSVDISSVYAAMCELIGYNMKVFDINTDELTNSCIAVGGNLAEGGVKDSELNGALRIFGRDRVETKQKIKEFLKIQLMNTVYADENKQLKEEIVKLQGKLNEIQGILNK